MTFIIRKDDFRSAAPWVADLQEGDVFVKSFASHRTLGDLKRVLIAIAPNANIHRLEDFA